MSKKLKWCLVIVLASALTTGIAWADLELYIPMDEGAGDIAADFSGNGRDGTLMGGPTWVAGAQGSALDFDGTDDYVDIDGYQGIVVVGGTQQPFSVTNWVKTTVATGNTEMVTWGSSPGGQRLTWRVHEGRLRTEHGSGNLRGNTYVNTDEWFHVALTVEEGANLRPDVTKLYVNGVEETYRNGSNNNYNLQPGANVNIGRRADNSSRYFPGSIDDVAIYSHVLTPEEIQDIMLNTALPIRRKATRPSPSNSATDIPYYINTLSWKPGDFAVKRNVYYGTSFADVNTAAAGALVAEGITETTFEVPTTDLETTYYWRVDEVNGAPDFTVHTGDVWSFTTEVVANLITNVSASADSQFNAGTVAENTVNGSGLTDGLHGITETDMWLATSLPATIQFDFDRTHALHEMHVWNQNQLIEALLGFGAKDVTIEVSTNGTDYTAIDGVGPLNQAPGVPGYAANNVIALNGTLASSVRLTITSGYGFLGQAGLSEVQFTSIPAFPREFSPAPGIDPETLDISLSWRAGRFAAEHRVLVGDQSSVEDGTAETVTTTDKSLALDLNYGELVYWRIIDVAADGREYASPIMSFYSPAVASLDGMEDYADEAEKEIWASWVDGFDAADNGSIVGNGITGAPESVEVYEGDQSLPMEYDLTSAGMAEATRTFDPALDLSAGVPETLGIYFKGEGPQLNGAYSTDGTTWTDMSWNPQQVAMSGDMLIGLAVTSHDAATPTTAVFSNVSTTGDVTGDWTQADIGGTHPADLFTEVGGAFTISAAGADIWTQNDEFRFVYKMLSGDGSITARVDSLESIHDWSKAGVMIRDTDATNASYGIVCATGINGTRFQARLTTNASAVSDSGVLDGIQQVTEEPVWVRIERKTVNVGASVYLTLTDTAGRSVKVAHPDPEATLLTDWTLLSVDIADLSGINASSIRSITIGVEGAGATGKIFADYLHLNTSYQPATPIEPSADGLIAHYEFEGDGSDSAGGNHGTLFGNATITADGKIGQGLNMQILPDDNGVDVPGYMAIDNFFYEASGLQEVTVALWVRVSGEQNQVLVSFDRNEYWRLQVNGEGGGPGQIGWSVWTSDGQVDYGSVDRVDDGQWHHVAGIFNRGAVRLFIDGVPQPGTRGGETFGRNNVRYGYIGTGSESTAFNLDPRTPADHPVGDVDDVRIYHRALSAGEIAWLASQ